LVFAGFGASAGMADGLVAGVGGGGVDGAVVPVPGGAPPGSAGTEDAGVGGAPTPLMTDPPEPVLFTIASASAASMNNVPRIVVARVSTVAPARAPNAV
jgi:hypothetical protein